MRVQWVTKAAAPAKANALLAALPEAVYRRLLPKLEPTTLRAGDVLFRSGGNVKFAYFSHQQHRRVDVWRGRGRGLAKAWPVGREGMLGISVFLGVRRLDCQAEVQVGGDAFRLPAAALMAEFRQAGALQYLLLRYVFALITQASQLGLCNRDHSIEQRLCRLLLLAFDRVGAEEIEFTQQRIAALLGVRRVSINQAAIKLQRDDLIEYVRGRVRLINRKRLEQRSCACSGIIARAFAAVAT